MNFEEFYGEYYPELQAAESFLTKLAEGLKTATCQSNDLNPIVYYCSRIKQPDSMIRKLETNGYQKTKESAMINVYDAVGLRIICSFAEDVYKISEMIMKDTRIVVSTKKDYYSHPKPNGYRSLHLCVFLPSFDLNAEIQIRTIAMDFWATLEHQIKYKKNIEHEKMLREELKRCADEIASLDLSMQTIREIIRDNSQ